ncbi:MAG TPA: glycoside hydrolase family 3 C-terminal domain-containing protein [Polyangiaceae bacterium LLY-WYZ-15_(1-7)]|nr:glycosyl hydrolase [Myxococcales bacterium]MAT27414.1 glycosyl hydrolase [Sandaracinus sp.]HJL05567.1 glycoside hydrolase family 3 C-terminal domain-containing protein [Polyangiaceae bacterium LLY-WYZ-15_(1-7)]HJL10753.1 glycoside hydrolase family 3 C-terminal domain-containing protein [Polyangiaceae bacterium LLY-WYZ-15_(1-7)]HJL39342.1 glycoside hydrolase family 3 C-terminal domain-containing protein [Polyangiaceae bacterium LLY-WYZ-15_(1-7)]
MRVAAARLVCLVALLGSAACASDAPREVAPSVAAYCGEDAEAVEARIDALLGEMTLDTKLRMMAGSRPGVVGGVWEVPGAPEHGVPGLHMLDGPRGLSAFTDLEGTAFPVGSARGATWDPELERRVGAAMARELRAAGADVLLAPTINILRHPRWGRTQETYGEDVHHLGEMGVAFIEGAQSERVIASAKHYAANSIDDTRFDVNVVVDERALREIYLPHFRRAVTEAQVGSIMSAYNFVNGDHCSESTHLLRDILKGEWGFAGFVESDWLLGTRRTAPAVNAGLDIEMPAGNHFARGRLLAAIDEGAIELETIDEAARRILRAQLCFDLDTDPALRDPARLPMEAHHGLAREVAERAMTLLRNEGGLPLERAGTLAVVGELAARENIGDLGSSNVRAPYVVTALEGIEAAAGGATVVHLSEPLDAEDEAALEAADAVVVVAGLTEDDEGEGGIASGDRESLALPRGQDALIEAVAARSERVVVVLEGSGPMLAPWLEEVEAVLMAWYPGMEGGHAIAAALFGDVNPSGRLPMSWPVAEADLPPFDNESLEVVYDYWHGYRHLERSGVAPAFPFGHGLSYTRFELGAPRLEREVLSGMDDALVVEVEVTNGGEREGVETVQLYVSVPESAVERAPRDLRAFGQVRLEPGASGTVRLEVPARSLAYWGEAGWTLERTGYVAHVGTSALDLPHAAPFRVE